MTTHDDPKPTPPPSPCWGELQVVQDHPPAYDRLVLVYIPGNDPFVAARYQGTDRDWWHSRKHCTLTSYRPDHRWCDIPMPPNHAVPE
jgi:hypothetical protein